MSVVESEAASAGAWDSEVAGEASWKGSRGSPSCDPGSGFFSVEYRRAKAGLCRLDAGMGLRGEAAMVWEAGMEGGWPTRGAIGERVIFADRPDGRRSRVIRRIVAN